MLRLGANKVIARWIGITVAATLLANLVPGVAWLAALIPERVWHGELWRLVTWVFIERGPVTLVWTCVAIYKLGGDLVDRWGHRGFLRYMIGVLGAAAAVTCLAAWASETIWHHVQLGGFAVGDALVIAWARQFPNRVIKIEGILDLNGRNLIAVTIAITCAYALFAGPLAMLPELAACAFAYYRGNR